MAVIKAKRRASPSPPPIASSPTPSTTWLHASNPGRPPRTAGPRTLLDPRTNTLIPAATRLLPLDAPPPRCTWPGCVNQALRAGSQPAEYLFQTRWRAWCYRHRPARIERDGLTRPTRPRYGPDFPLPADRPQCHVPGCGRPATIKNRRASDGTPRFKRWCDTHAHAPDTIPANLRVLPTPPRADRPVPSEATVTRIRVSAPQPSTPPSTISAHGTSVKFKDEGKWYTRTVPPQDIACLEKLYKEDATPYRASTDPRLSQKYPTTLITTLFAKWRA